MNQNETEFGEDLTHRQLLALPRRSEAGPHLGRAGPERAWTRRVFSLSGNVILRLRLRI